MRCLGCEGFQFTHASEMVRIERIPARDVVEEEGVWPFRRKVQVHYEQRIVKIALGFVARCVACGLQQMFDPEGVHHIGADPGTTTIAPAKRVDPPRDPNQEERPPMKTRMDRDIPLRRRRPYA